MLAGLLFEAGAAPVHFWVPDAAQGAGGTAAAFLTTVPKVGALLAVYRLVTVLPATVEWPLLVGVLAVASMTLATSPNTHRPTPAGCSAGRRSARSGTSWAGRGVAASRPVVGTVEGGVPGSLVGGSVPDP